MNGATVVNDMNGVNGVRRPLEVERRVRLSLIPLTWRPKPKNSMGGGLPLDFGPSHDAYFIRMAFEDASELQLEAKIASTWVPNPSKSDSQMHWIANDTKDWFLHYPRCKMLIFSYQKSIKSMKNRLEGI